jgi:uncharacterized membrane protein
MRKWIPALLIVAAVVVSIVAYPSLPESVPTHWGMSGEPNGWSSRFWGAWMLPLLMAFIWVIMRALPHIDPRKANYEKFRGIYELFISGILAFMLAMHIVVLKSATGSHIEMDRVVFVAVGALFVLIGAALPRIHPNWFFGIRTPWTMSSDLSWERTHKIGGPLFIVLGVISMASTLVAPKASPWILICAALVTTVFLFAYSYRVWKEDPVKRSA